MATDNELPGNNARAMLPLLEELAEKAAEIERLRALLLEARGWLNSRSALAKDIDCMLRVPNYPGNAPPLGGRG